MEPLNPVKVTVEVEPEQMVGLVEVTVPPNEILETVVLKIPEVVDGQTPFLMMVTNPVDVVRTGVVKKLVPALEVEVANPSVEYAQPTTDPINPVAVRFKVFPEQTVPVPLAIVPLIEIPSMVWVKIEE